MDAVSVQMLHKNSSPVGPRREVTGGGGAFAREVPSSITV